jgi:ribosome-associated translation inhibitor RaiA
MKDARPFYLSIGLPLSKLGGDGRCRLLSDGPDESQAMRSHVERRVGSALGRFGPRVERVTVRLSNQQESAVPGVRCGVTLSLVDGRVSVEDSGDEPFEAISRAVDRAGRAMGREVDRQGATI